MSSLAWIGWVLTAAGLVTGYLYFRANRKIKRIEWWIVSDQDLINFPGTDIAEEITVLVDGQELRRPRAIQVIVMNTGNVGLNTKSMYEMFQIRCVGDQELHAASVRRTSAKQSRTEEVPTVVALGSAGRADPGPTLLNPGDYLTCQLLVDGPSGRVEVVGEAEDFEIYHQVNGDSETFQPVSPSLGNHSLLLSIGPTLVGGVLVAAALVIASRLGGN